MNKLSQKNRLTFLTIALLLCIMSVIFQIYIMSVIFQTYIGFTSPSALRLIGSLGYAILVIIWTGQLIKNWKSYQTKKQNK